MYDETKMNKISNILNNILLDLVNKEQKNTFRLVQNNNSNISSTKYNSTILKNNKLDNISSL